MLTVYQVPLADINSAGSVLQTGRRRCTMHLGTSKLAVTGVLHPAQLLLRSKLPIKHFY